MAKYRKGYKVNPKTGLTAAEERAGLTRRQAEALAREEAKTDSPARTSPRTTATKNPQKAAGKRHRTRWILGIVGGVVLLVIILSAALGSGGGSSGQGAEPGAPAPPPASPAESLGTRLTSDDVPDVLMPGVWHGIRGVYRKGSNVSIYTNWTDRRKLDATGACWSAAGDLGYTVAVTVYGASSKTLATCKGVGAP